MKIKKSIGDKALSITIETSLSHEYSNHEKTSVSLENFLLGKWTWSIEKNSFSLCQEVTEQEQAIFRTFILTSEYDYETIYHMPTTRFIELIKANDAIDWVPATYPIIENIANFSKSPRKLKYKDKLDRFLHHDKPQTQEIFLERIKIPKNIEELYIPKNIKDYVEMEKYEITEESTQQPDNHPPEVRNNEQRNEEVPQDSEKCLTEEVIHHPATIKESQKASADGSESQQEKESELHSKNPPPIKQRLNHVEEFTFNYLKDNPDAKSEEIWSAAARSENINIKPPQNSQEEAKLIFRKKRPNEKEKNGPHPFSTRYYTESSFRQMVNEIKDTIKNKLNIEDESQIKLKNSTQEE